MSNYIVDGADLTSVANAIRTKGGTSAQLAFPADFVQAIEDIETGGGGEWTTNGVANGTEPSGVIRISTPSVIDHAFYKNSAITGVIIDAYCAIETYGFNSCPGMTFFVSQIGTTIKAQGVAYNTKLQTVDIKINTINQSLSLAGNSKLTALILRRTDAITSMGQTNALNGSKSTSKPIHVYVPSALKATYESASNWSTWVADGTIVFETLEGSQYESEDWWQS